MNLEYNAVQYYFSRFFYLARQPQWPMASSFTRLLDHTQRRIPVGRKLLELEDDVTNDDDK